MAKKKSKKGDQVLTKQVKKTDEKGVVSERELTREEAIECLAYLTRLKDRQIPKFELDDPKDLDSRLVKHKGDDLLHQARMANTLKTDDSDAAWLLLNQAVSTLPSDANRTTADKLNTAIAVIDELKPRDQLESLLITQMVGVHNLAMEFLGRANRNGQSFDVVSANADRATKMLRTFTAQMEALNRHRGKGQQKMTVEHVHVHEGGQAIVGNVNHPPTGSTFNREQSVKEGGSK